MVVIELLSVDALTVFAQLSFVCGLCVSLGVLIPFVLYAAVNALTPYMEEGQGSVGTHLDISHDSATPIGMKVWAEAEVTAVDGKALTFSVTAYDEAGVIGKGTHNRFIITVDRFLAKSEKKKEGR